MRISCAVRRSSVLSEGPVNVESSRKEGAGLCDEEWCWKRGGREGCGTDLLAVKPAQLRYCTYLRMGLVISVAVHISYCSRAGMYGDSPFPGHGLLLGFIIQF